MQKKPKMITNITQIKEDNFYLVTNELERKDNPAAGRLRVLAKCIQEVNMKHSYPVADMLDIEAYEGVQFEGDWFIKEKNLLVTWEVEEVSQESHPELFL